MNFNERFPKNDPIWEFSNPETAQKKAYYIYGNNAMLFRSETQDKKYAILNSSGKVVNFGQMGYEDYTKHNDPIRRNSYLRRSKNIKGKWKADEYSPNWLSISILW